MRAVQTVGLAAALLFFAGTLPASLTTQVDFQGLQKSTANISLPGYSNSLSAGILQFSQRQGDLNFKNGESFAAFCIELTENISGSNNPYTYSVIDPQYAPNSKPMGSDRAELLKSWFGHYYISSNVTEWTTLQATAFQLGVWEIVYENYSAIGNVSSGQFWMDSSHSGRAAVAALTEVNSWFSVFNPLGEKMQIAALSSPHGSATQHIQDAVTIQVPEPSTMLILGMGCVLALYKRRRKITADS